MIQGENLWIQMTTDRAASRHGYPNGSKVWTCWSQKCIHPTPERDSSHSEYGMNPAPRKIWGLSPTIFKHHTDFLAVNCHHVEVGEAFGTVQVSEFMKRGSLPWQVFVATRLAMGILLPASTLMGQCEGVLTHKSHLKSGDQSSTQYTSVTSVTSAACFWSGGCAWSPSNQKVEQIAVTATASLSNSPPTDLTHVCWGSTLLLSQKFEEKR